MRFTQDGTPTCSRARIASYDGKALAGRGVVEAPEQRGEHRRRLRADLAVGLAFSWWGIMARATIITRTLALRSSGTRRPGPKTFSRGPMPRRDLERAVGCVLWPIAPALLRPRLPVSVWLARLALASAAAKVSAAAWAASFASASWCPFLTRAAPGAKRREARPVNDCESKLGSWSP
jgi:hypothetical protein